MRSCPRCGAAIIDADAGRCAICGAEVVAAGAPDDASLPPLPDGGLAAALPDWLREPPIAPTQPPLLTEADLPRWLLTLADRDDSGPDPPTPATAPDPPRIAPLFLPDAPLPTPVAAAPKHISIDEAARDREHEVVGSARRQRVGLAAAALLVVLALLILLAWASGVRLPGLS